MPADAKGAKVVRMSRFFHGNTYLVAGMCSKCYQECRDVKIVAVNGAFLEQLERRKEKLAAAQPGPADGHKEPGVNATGSWRPLAWCGNDVLPERHSSDFCFCLDDVQTPATRRSGPNDTARVHEAGRTCDDRSGNSFGQVRMVGTDLPATTRDSCDFKSAPPNANLDDLARARAAETNQSNTGRRANECTPYVIAPRENETLEDASEAREKLAQREACTSTVKKESWVATGLWERAAREDASGATAYDEVETVACRIVSVKGTLTSAALETAAKDGRANVARAQSSEFSLDVKPHCEASERTLANESRGSPGERQACDQLKHGTQTNTAAIELAPCPPSTPKQTDESPPTKATEVNAATEPWENAAASDTLAKNYACDKAPAGEACEQAKAIETSLISTGKQPGKAEPAHQTWSAWENRAKNTSCERPSQNDPYENTGDSNLNVTVKAAPKITTRNEPGTGSKKQPRQNLAQNENSAWQNAAMEDHLVLATLGGYANELEDVGNTAACPRETCESRNAQTAWQYTNQAYEMLHEANSGAKPREQETCKKARVSPPWQNGTKTPASQSSKPSTKHEKSEKDASDGENFTALRNIAQSEACGHLAKSLRSESLAQNEGRSCDTCDSIGENARWRNLARNGPHEHLAKTPLRPTSPKEDGVRYSTCDGSGGDKLRKGLAKTRTYEQLAKTALYANLAKEEDFQSATCCGTHEKKVWRNFDKFCEHLANDALCAKGKGFQCEACDRTDENNVCPILAKTGAYGHCKSAILATNEGRDDRGRNALWYNEATKNGCENAPRNEGLVDVAASGRCECPVKNETRLSAAPDVEIHSTSALTEDAVGRVPKLGTGTFVAPDDRTVQILRLGHRCSGERWSRYFSKPRTRKERPMLVRRQAVAKPQLDSEAGGPPDVKGDFFQSDASGGVPTPLKDWAGPVEELGVRRQAVAKPKLDSEAGGPSDVKTEDFSQTDASGERRTPPEDQKCFLEEPSDVKEELLSKPDTFENVEGYVKVEDLLFGVKGPELDVKAEDPVKDELPPGSQEPPWHPPRSPHNLIEEALYDNPWSLLVATIFLNKTSCMAAKPYIEWFLADFPGPLEVLKREPADLEKYFVTIGLKKRAHQIWRMSHDYVHRRWKSVRELHGIGRYGHDAYNMFCLGNMEVEPKDRFLRIYKAWFHMVEEHKVRGCCPSEDEGTSCSDDCGTSESEWRGGARS